MIAQLRAALTLFALLTLITGIAYPLVVTAIGQAVFPYQANGSLIRDGNQILGSELIGQSFEDPNHFWGRPSATEPANNALSSSGSNLGPTNPALIEAVRSRIEELRQAHPDQTGPIPVDLVTASASGLDPHISVSAAKFQVQRVAKARGLATSQVEALIAEHIEKRTFGILGEPRVNVLCLNRALDGISK